MATYSTAQEWELVTIEGSTPGNTIEEIIGPGNIVLDTNDGYQYMLMSAKTIATSGSFTNVAGTLFIARETSGTTHYGTTQQYSLYWARGSVSQRADGIFQYNMNDGTAFTASNNVVTRLDSSTHSPMIPRGHILSFSNTNPSGIITNWVFQIARFK